MSYGVNIWEIEGIDHSYLDKARDTLENELAPQVDFGIETWDMGDAPSHLQDCSKSEEEVLNNFENWLQNNNNVLEGEHHMLIVDCWETGWGGWAHGELSTDCDTTKWGRSVVNAALHMYAHNYYRNAVIHEFSHTAMTGSECPTDEHTCGSTYKDANGNATVTPMMTSYAKDCTYDADCGNDLCSADKYIMDLSTCTENGLEGYHDANSGGCGY